MRAHSLSLALAALIAAAAAVTPAAAQQSVTQSSGGNAPAAPATTAAAPDSCTPGPIDDGVYTAEAREGRNRERRNNADNDDADAASAEGMAITQVKLTWQCGGDAPDGAYIPTGYRMDVTGECPSGTCELGTTVATTGAREGLYVASLADDQVGNRDFRLSARRKNVTLVVRTDVEGERRPAQARYVLERSGS